METATIKSPDPNDDEAMDWAKLNYPYGRDVGAREVYRIHTVGGKTSRECKGRKKGERWGEKYSAQYWVFGRVDEGEGMSWRDRARRGLLEAVCRMEERVREGEGGLNLFFGW